MAHPSWVTASSKHQTGGSHFSFSPPTAPVIFLERYELSPERALELSLSPLTWTNSRLIGAGQTKQGKTKQNEPIFDILQPWNHLISLLSPMGRGKDQNQCILTRKVLYMPHERAFPFPIQERGCNLLPGSTIRDRTVWKLTKACVVFPGQG